MIDKVMDSDTAVDRIVYSDFLMGPCECVSGDSGEETEKCQTCIKRERVAKTITKLINSERHRVADRMEMAKQLYVDAQGEMTYVRFEKILEIISGKEGDTNGD